jgi:hypothetical protein
MISFLHMARNSSRIWQIIVPTRIFWKVNINIVLLALSCMFKSFHYVNLWSHHLLNIFLFALIYDLKFILILIKNNTFRSQWVPISFKNCAISDNTFIDIYHRFFIVWLTWYLNVSWQIVLVWFSNYYFLT